MIVFFMERSEAGTEPQPPASEGLLGCSEEVNETAVERPAQHGPGPPACSTVVEHDSPAPDTVQQEAQEDATAHASVPAEQQIGRLQAELAAVKQSLATYESTLQHLLGAQLLPSVLQQQQRQHSPALAMQVSSSSERQGDNVASSAAPLAQVPARQQQDMPASAENQTGGMGVLHTSIGSVGSSVGAGSEGAPLLSREVQGLDQQSLQFQQEVEQGVALRLSVTSEGSPLSHLQDRQHLEQSLTVSAAGRDTPPAPSSGSGLFGSAADAPAVAMRGAGTRLQSSTSAPVMGDAILSALLTVGQFGLEPAGTSSGALQLGSSIGTAEAVAAALPSSSSGFDFLQAGTSPPGLLPGFPTSPEGLIMSPGGSGVSNLIRSSPGIALSPIGGAGGGAQQQQQQAASTGAFPPPLPAVRQLLRQSASLTSPPSGSGSLTPELAGSSSAGYAEFESAGQSLPGFQPPGHQQRHTVSPRLSYHGLVPDTAGSLSSSLSPAGLAAAAAAAASTAGSFSLMSAVVGGSSAGAAAAATSFEQDVVPGGSTGDQLTSPQLQALHGSAGLFMQQQHGSEDVAAAAAEQYLLAQQLQQQAAEVAGYGGPAQVAQTEQLLAAMQQYGIKDPAAAMVAAAAAGQPGVLPGFGWDPAAAAAAAASAGLDPGPSASYQAQQAAQALANLNLQVQAEQLQAYQQAQFMQQLQQQYSNPYAQQLLVAQAAAAAAAAAAMRQQHWQQAGVRGKLAAAHPGSGSSSGSSRRSSKGTDVYSSSVSRDVRKGGSSKAGASSSARAGRSSDEAPDWRRVFVGNIGWWVDEEMLKNVFGEYGTILDAQVMWNTKLLAKGKRVNREFAFISYTTPEQAAVAIRHMHGRYIEGITKDRDGLTVQFEAQGIGKPPLQGQQQQAQLPPALQQLTTAAALQQQQTAAGQQQQLLMQQLQQQQQQQGALHMLYHHQQQQQQGQYSLLQQLQGYQQQQQVSGPLLGLSAPGLYGSQGGGPPTPGAPGI